ncbi:MAG: hypothetical protein ACYCWW_05360, partial [Deltaproteobacteria bacterium]
MSRAIEDMARAGGVFGRVRQAISVLLSGAIGLLLACGPLLPGSGGSGFSFAPSNVSLAEITKVESLAQVENQSGSCSITTDATAPSQDCFASPIEAVTQPDGTTVDLIVAKSITVQTNAVVTVTGSVPLVLVSLSDVTWSGQLLANSPSPGLWTGPGGAPEAASSANGIGGGGGAAGSATALIGGGGGSNCGLGGPGAGQTSPGTAFGNPSIRPLVGGASGGGGALGSGEGL